MEKSDSFNRSQYNVAHRQTASNCPASRFCCPVFSGYGGSYAPRLIVNGQPSVWSI
jgi:hypothetical protein